MRKGTGAPYVASLRKRTTPGCLSCASEKLERDERSALGRSVSRCGERKRQRRRIRSHKTFSRRGEELGGPGPLRRVATASYIHVPSLIIQSAIAF